MTSVKSNPTAYLQVWKNIRQKVRVNLQNRICFMHVKQKTQSWELVLFGQFDDNDDVLIELAINDLLGREWTHLYRSTLFVLLNVLPAENPFDDNKDSGFCD